VINIKKPEILFLLSASNLFLFKYWLTLGIFSEEMRYYFFNRPTLEIFLGITLLLTFFFVFLIIFFFLKKNNLIYLKNLFTLFLFLVVLDILRSASNILPVSYFYENKLVSILIFLLTAGLYMKYINFFSNSIQFLFIIFSPFVIIIFINLFNLLFLLNWQGNKELIKNKNYEVKKEKIILIVFDELDFRVLKKGNYTNFNKILNKSDVYSNAFPSGDATLTIIPSILTGSQLPFNTNKFNFLINEIIYEHEGKKKELSKQKNLFSLLDDEKYKLGILAMYHRYCNIFYNNVNACHELNDEQFTIKNLGFKKYLIYSIMDIIPGSAKIKLFRNLNPQNFNQYDLPKLRIENIKQFIKISPTLLDNNDFIYIHIPLPHPPWIYENKNFSINAFSQFEQDGYYENMNLTDFYLGQIIEHLQQKAIFDSSTIILLSDHGWRTGDKSFIGSNAKKIDNRGGDVLLSIKNKNQLKKNNIDKKIFNYELFYIIKQMLKN
jgi:hypothetical protein